MSLKLDPLNYFYLFKDKFFPLIRTVSFMKQYFKFKNFYYFHIIILWILSLVIFMTNQSSIMGILFELKTFYYIHVITYWFFSLIAYIADRKLDPMTYKIQVGTSDKNRHYLNKYTSNVIINVLVNHLFVLPPLIIMSGYFLRRKFSDPLNDFNTCLFQLIINYILHEFQFYFYHRLLHTDFLFKNVHKIHHEFVVPIGIAGQYVHPIEFIILFIQIMSSSLILNMHPILLIMWIIFVNLINVASHSGFIFSFYASHYHDIHHQLFKYNYGASQWIDDLFGTSFRSAKTII